MPLDLFFLESTLPLTKTFVKSATGIVKTPYPFVWEFTSHKEQVTSLAQFEAELKGHATKSHCLLKGTIRRDLVKESRAGSTESNAVTEWVVLDLDGLPDTMPTIDAFLQAIGLDDVSHIVQWSASYGVENKKLRAHIFFMLDKPMAATVLKQWLIHINHSVSLLRNAMSLTKTGNSISWPLDISACQNDKLIYIAPPVLKGIKDPVPAAQRIILVRRKLDKLSIPHTFNSEKNRVATQKRLEELREAEGLPKRKWVTKMHGSIEILAKPDVCTITDMKTERGFVYFNLNGGDSWAYYHPENNPEFILNFKGEATYLTKELLPDYWAELSTQSVRTGSDGTTYLAFCDRKTAAYWIGTYDQKTDSLDINLAKTPTQVREFAKQVGMPLGDFIPYWDLTFDPANSLRVDFNNRIVNTYSPSPIAKLWAQRPAKFTPPHTPPKTIAKVIDHALGHDKAVYDHFINWLAFIFQFKDRTKTAWVLHGVPGTGKGIMMNNIIRPMLGVANTAARRMEELNEPYNHFMKNSFVVFVDEVQTKALANERGVMAKLKNFITEELVPIRQMYSNAAEARNYTNWIFASNMSDPVAIDKNDRRFNVAKYQPTKLLVSDKEIAQIERELSGFYAYLMAYACDQDKARNILETEDRATMIDIAETSIDTVTSRMLEGDFEFFMDQLPHSAVPLTDFNSLARVETYKQVLVALVERTHQQTGACNVSREELRMIFNFVIGGMPDTPNKFTSLLKHHRIHIEKVWMDTKAVSGIKVTWRSIQKFPKYLEALRPKVGASTMTKGKSSSPKPAVKKTKDLA